MSKKTRSRKNNWEFPEFLLFVFNAAASILSAITWTLCFYHHNKPKSIMKAQISALYELRIHFVSTAPHFSTVCSFTFFCPCLFTILPLVKFICNDWRGFLCWGGGYQWKSKGNLEIKKSKDDILNMYFTFT